MIEGRIDPFGTAYVGLKVAGLRGEVEIEAILDTGFNGQVCLPLSVAVPLGLELAYTSQFELADGTLVQDELVFVGKAFWRGEYRDVEIVLTRSGEALLGTGLLEGAQVQLDFARGTVSVDKAATSSG